MIHFSRHFKGALTFLTPKLSLEMANKVIVPQKINYLPQFLKQRDINSYYVHTTVQKGKTNTGQYCVKGHAL